uniref:(northern house mosquito) hypothetical protein n=1 Tax=Culex pipiens TaxID=7175 RepID=A0A8D8FN55_CULPI
MRVADLRQPSTAPSLALAHAARVTSLGRDRRLWLVPAAFAPRRPRTFFATTRGGRFFRRLQDRRVCRAAPLAVGRRRLHRIVRAPFGGLARPVDVLGLLLVQIQVGGGHLDGALADPDHVRHFVGGFVPLDLVDETGLVGVAAGERVYGVADDRERVLVADHDDVLGEGLRGAVLEQHHVLVVSLVTCDLAGVVLPVGPTRHTAQPIVLVHWWFRLGRYGSVRFLLLGALRGGLLRLGVFFGFGLGAGSLLSSTTLFGGGFGRLRVGTALVQFGVR